LLQHLLAIDVYELLRNAREKRCTDSADFRPLARCGEECRKVFCKERDVFAGAILEDKRYSTRRADARYSRWRETKRSSNREPAEFLIQSRFDGLKLCRPGRPLIPGLQTDKEKRVIASPNITEQAEPDHANGVLDAGRVCENLFHLFRCRAGAFQ
jgi:hypothetical protein